MRLLFTALACLISVSLFGQEWMYNYGDSLQDYGYDVQQTTDGGFIITGATYGENRNWTDVSLMKIDVDGQLEWHNTFGSEWTDGGSSVQQTTDGGYIIGGYTCTSSGDLDIFLFKTDEYGIEEWSKTFGGTQDDGEACLSVQQTSDGGYILSGYSSTFGSDSIWSDAFLLKTDENGIEEWTQTYGGIDPELSYSVKQTSDGGYVLTGNQGWLDLWPPPSFNNQKMFLIKTDEYGIEEWTQTYVNGMEESCSYGRDVQQTSDGGFIIAGAKGDFDTYDDSIPNQIFLGAVLVKTNQFGEEEWTSVFDQIPNLANGYSKFESVTQTSDGGFIACGRTTFTNSSIEFPGLLFIVKTDSNGSEEWSHRVYENCIGNKVINANDGGFVITGSIWVTDLSYQAFLLKIDSEGTLSSSFTIPTPSQRKLEKVVDALGREVNQTTNQILFYIYDDGSVEKKFIVE